MERGQKEQEPTTRVSGGGNLEWSSKSRLLPGLTLRGSQSKKEERKLKIPEISHMRATLELNPTPIHTEIPKQTRRRRTLMACAK